MEIPERKITVHVPADLLERAQRSSGQGITELLSDPALSHGVRDLLASLPILEVEPGFWVRAGMLRASILKQRRKARVADALIAQNCLDQATPLVTRDRDFRHFARSAGLQIL